MKYLGITLMAAVMIVNQSSVLAQSPSASPSASVKTTVTPTPVDNALQELKEKVESKISEKLKNTKAVAGVVTKVDKSNLTIETDNKDTYDIKLDDTLTNYYQISGTSTKELEKEDIEKGDYIIVTGPQFDKSINANVIYVDEKYIVGSGKITEVNKDDYSIKVLTEDKETYTLDIQTKTQQQIVNIKTLELERIGFSKLKEGDTIHFIFIKSDPLGKEVRFDAEKILIIPQEYFLK